MRFSTVIGTMALCGSAIAVPAPDAPKPTPPPVLVNRDDGDHVWVSVIRGGQDREVTTLTPHVTTINGNATTENAPPYSLTGTSFTTMILGTVHTYTHLPNPTANSMDGTDAVFERCHNMDGPICRPFANSTLEGGKKYIVAWDPDYFPKNHPPAANDTGAANNTANPVSSEPLVGIRLQIWNTTRNDWQIVSVTDNKFNASSGFGVINADDFQKVKNDGKNISIALATFQGSGTVDGTPAGVAVPLMVTTWALPSPAQPSAPSGAGLYIGIPVAFGAVILIVIGGCIWNRKTRRIELGSLLNRKRGYSGRGTRRRMFNADDHADIQLHNNDTPAYRDTPSDVLHDSDNFHETGTTGGRNAFRDEVARQDTERRGNF